MPRVATRVIEATRRAHVSFYRSLNPPLLRYLRHHVGPVAEDVASDVWLALAPQLAGFDGTFADLRALMFTVARRRVVDHYRRNGRPPAVPFDDEAFDCADAEETETLVLDEITAQGAVEALVHCLPADQAEIVLLRVLGDLDVEQSRGDRRQEQRRGARRPAPGAATAAADLSEKICNTVTSRDDFPVRWKHSPSTTAMPTPCSVLLRVRIPLPRSSVTSPSWCTPLVVRAPPTSWSAKT